MISPAETTINEARALISMAMTYDPRLCHFGIGIFDERGEIRRHGREFVENKLADERRALEAAGREVQAAADWIKGQQRAAAVNKGHSSYGYKHCVERWFRTKGTPVYVANGAFIAAARGLGWEYETEGPNALFAFCEHTVRKPYAFESAWVYFVQAGSDRGGAIKIGYSVDVEKRVEQIKTGNHHAYPVDTQRTRS